MRVRYGKVVGFAGESDESLPNLPVLSVPPIKAQVTNRKVTACQRGRGVACTFLADDIRSSERTSIHVLRASSDTLIHELSSDRMSHIYSAADNRPDPCQPSYNQSFKIPF